MTPRELGPYLLLRKLSEDALGEVYRAGQKSGEDVERVVLLYFFKADQEDAAWLAETATVGRRALKGLSAPTLADLVDSGEAAGTAYLAYEYISGVGLRELVAQARREGSPVPLEAAIHVVDRVANALVAAWEHESRMLHGFVVPHLVQLSTEGEVHLLGIEVASRLRRLLTEPNLESEVRSYLAPEVVPQSQAATTDDVYSLGALLYALVTGAPLPADAADPRALIEEATLPDGSELPDDLRQILHGGLAPAQDRARLTDFYERLHELVLSDRYDATSFNLAVYLHRLFGEDLEEAEEVAREEAPPSAPPDVSEPEPLAVEPATTAEDHDFGSPEIPPPDPDGDLLERAADERRSRLPYLAAAAVLALAAVGGGLYYYLGRDAAPEVRQAATPALEPATTTLGADTDPAPPFATPDQAGDAASPSATTIAGEEATADSGPALTEEELDRQVRDLVEKQSKEIEGALRDEYEQEVAALREQLAELSAARSRQESAAGPATRPAAPTDTANRAGATTAQEVAEPDPTLAEAATERGPSGSSGDSIEAVPTTPVDPPLSTSTDTAAESDADSAPSAPIEPETTSSGAPVTTGAVEETTGEEPSSSTAAETRAEPSDQRAEAEESGDTAGGAETRPASRPAADTTAREPLENESAGREPAEDEPAEPPVRFGELVTAGPGVAAPELERSVQPVYPMMARRLGRSATVDLRVLIDESGQVVEVERVGDEAGFGFDEAAVAAARRMEWKPATKKGVRVKIWWPVRIAFQP